MSDRPAKALLVAVAALSFGLLPPIAARATTPRTDWPRFHFDNGNTGYNPFENVLNPSNVAGLVQKWAVPTVPGTSPSPIVAGGLVFVAPADGIVRALDRSTGETVWSTDTGGQMQAGFAPTYSKGVLFVGNGVGHVLALDARTGQVIWDAHPGDVVDSDPVVSNGRVYVGEATGGSTDQGYALDASTGATEFTMDFPLNDSPALAYGLVDTSYKFGGQVVALNALTGTVAWDNSFGGEIVDTDSPAVANRTAFAGVVERLWSIDDQTGHVNWHVPAGGSIDSAPAIANGVVYFDPSENLSAFNARTGKVLWRVPTPGASGSSAAVANHVVYVGTAGGTLQAYEAATGALLWESANAGSSFGGSPAIADGVLYGSTADGTIYAFGLP
jgi:outer membrane protein assembly factor BamB